jgi:hypothetical protein
MVLGGRLIASKMDLNSTSKVERTGLFKEEEIFKKGEL